SAWTPSSSACGSRRRPNASACCRSHAPRRVGSSAVGNRLPPLAPPVGADQDAQLRVPAIRDLGRVLEVVPAVLAMLLALRLSLEHRVVRQVPQLDGELLVDLLRFRFGDLVVSHGVDLPLSTGWRPAGIFARS